jgi:hypothetical protein
MAQVATTYRSTDGRGTVVVDRASIGPGASRTLYQPALDSLPNGFVGSATLAVENGQLLAGLVNEVNYERNVSATYQLLSGGQPVVYAPLLLRGVEGLGSGLQVHNLGQLSTGVTLTYRDQSGTALVVQTDTIEAGAAKTYFQPAVQGLPEGFTGTAIVSSDGQPLAAIVNTVGY